MKMDGIFNAVDIFKIAETIEENGAKFYSDAAKLFPGEDVGKMFANLTEWELQHKKVFAEMRGKITQQHPKLGPGTEEYKSVAALSTFSLWSGPYRQLSEIENREDAIRQALTKEKDTIVFYVGLKDFVASKEDKEIINDIIKEEMRHIAILTEALGNKI